MTSPLETLSKQTGLRVGLCSRGIARIEHISQLLPFESASYEYCNTASDSDVLIGWGNKPSGQRAADLAVQSGKPCLFLEDAFLRSYAPQSVSGEQSLGLIIDDQGIYYDASRPSRLEALIKSTCGNAEAEQRGTALVARLCALQVSKYNNFAPDTALAQPARQDRQRVLVVDQTWQDQSVNGAGADQHSFAAMLLAAHDENPGAEVIVKLHPEVLAGKKQGYLKNLAQQNGCTLLTANINPWHLFAHVDKVYTVSSQLGFDALLAGVDVRCFGMPFYAGWGLTSDEMIAGRRAGHTPTLAGLTHAAYNLYANYIDAYDRTPSDAATVAGQLADIRNAYTENAGIGAFYQVTAWKRKRVKAMFVPHARGKVFYMRPHSAIKAAARRGGALVAWSSRMNDTLEADCAKQGVKLYRLEDGFIRSVGLGASFHLPMSLILDDRGIYYDPRRPSRLEHILQTHEFDDELTARAARLIETLVEKNITKYNLTAAKQTLTSPDGKRVILAPGQVDDDASIKYGGSGMTGLDLINTVRETNPDAYVIFKPHPDVVSGLRPGLNDKAKALEYADHFAENMPIEQLVALSDEVHTISSLTGFEALLRGKDVTCYGLPFYAGWGLTKDTQSCSRRTRKLTLNQLTAATLILYPRYHDPISRLPCGPEVVIRRIESNRECLSQQSLIIRLRLMYGRLRRLC